MTEIIINPDETLTVTSTDPMVPDAKIFDRHAACERCGALIYLPALDHDGKPNGDEYQLHYLHEHVLPDIRYEETSQ